MLELTEINWKNEITNQAKIVLLPNCFVLFSYNENPTFDMIPPELVSGIVTEKGVITPPYDWSTKKLFEAN